MIYKLRGSLAEWGEAERECVCVCARACARGVRACLLSHVLLFATLWTVAHQASLSMEFPRQEYCSGLPFPPPGIFQTQGLNLCLLFHSQQTYFILLCSLVMFPFFKTIF